MLLSTLVSLWGHVTAGNVLLALFFLFLVNLLVELYEFRGMPPGPRLYSFPLIGNLFSMETTGSSLRENTQRLREAYGRVFSLRLGRWKAVIVSSPESIKEVLIRKSADFGGRPQFWSTVFSTLGGKSLVMQDDGAAWKLHRKICGLNLRQYLNNSSLVESNISIEAQRIVSFMEKQTESPFDPRKIFLKSVGNVISRIVFGVEYDIDHPKVSQLQMLLDQGFKDKAMNAETFTLDLFPIAKYIPFKSYKKLAALSDRKFQLCRSILREKEHHEVPTQFFSSLTANLLESKREMVDKNAKESRLSEDYILNIMNDMFVAGWETISSTLLWAIAFLVNNPKLQVQLQEHIDHVVGRGRLPNLAERSNLPLLQAFIMEVQRLGNIAAETPLHCATKDTTLCGYRVPKDTIVFVDLASLHLNSECWENPEEFNPYRYIDHEGLLITDQGNWLPFGAGRRSCAGESLAKVELFLFLSIMIHEFTFAPEDVQTPPSLRGTFQVVRSPLPYRVKAIKRI